MIKGGGIVLIDPKTGFILWNKECTSQGIDFGALSMQWIFGSEAMQHDDANAGAAGAAAADVMMMGDTNSKNNNGGEKRRSIQGGLYQ
jgi:hypothetical protein